LRLFSKSSFDQCYCLPGLSCPKFLIFPTETSPLFDSSEVIESWTSSESILWSQRISFTPTFAPGLSLPYIKSRFTRGRNWFYVCPTNSLPRLSPISNPGYRCLDTS
jgi:hypothetical protein